MSSPYSTGGGGFHFEMRVTAYYCAAILTKAPARGLQGQHATKILTQRASFNEPLDDLIIYGIASDDLPTKLSLQVKNSLTFTEKNAQWISVLGQAWDTFKSDTFDGTHHRIGVAIGSYNARVDKYFQSLLAWAVQSPSANNFFERISCADFSHKDQRNFVKTTRKILARHSEENVSDEDLWKFLCVFQILYFDFNNEENSQSVEPAIDHIRSSLKPEERGKARQIWDHLIVLAGKTAVTGGGAKRTTLLKSLKENGLPALSNETLDKDIMEIDRDSKFGMQDIKLDIQGLHLKRNSSYDEIQEALSDGRFIQICGEPGSGKSALLKQIAEKEAQTGPVFFLKDGRIHPRGWTAHASKLGVTNDLKELLSEFACANKALLFIDGLDKITDPAVQLTVNDLVRSIATDPDLSDWKILITVRVQNLERIFTWLDPDALKHLSVRSVTVPTLKKDELKIVSDKFPWLRSLLLENKHADVILHRPFFIKSIISLADDKESTALPASEAELLQLWWKLGGSDDSSDIPVHNRRNTLIKLAEQFILAPTKPISIRDLSPEPLSDLKNAGVILDVRQGDTVRFAHDIYEEWALCRWLMDQVEKASVSDVLRSKGEPQELIRPLQLLGTYFLKSSETDSEWRALFDDVNQKDLRPVWQQTLLTSCLRSTRTVEILRKLSDLLNENNHAVLKKLLNALQMLEVDPDPIYLNEKIWPNLEPKDRIWYSHSLALPKVPTWTRFFNWFFASKSDPPPSLIPNLVPVFKTWQSAREGRNIHHCKRIGEIVQTWLMEFEAVLHSTKPEDRQKPFGINFSYQQQQDLAKEIRYLFLMSVGDVTDKVKEYLTTNANNPLPHRYRDEVLDTTGNVIVQHLPETLTDYIMGAFFKHPKNDNSYSDGIKFSGLGFVGSSSFSPPSPLQPPFLELLRNHPQEGLRLVRKICNFSIDVWRWRHQPSDHNQKGRTPIAVEIEFPWGLQSFWGDADVYRWFRGGYGNIICRSALMALEYWAFKRIEYGDDFAETLQKIVEGHESAAALGLAVSLCIAQKDKELEHILPLITCPYVWEWDLYRFSDELHDRNYNELCNWGQDRYMLSAVQKLNQKPHRKFFIGAMTGYLKLLGDEDLIERYAAGIRSFPERLPFEYEEDKLNEESVDNLRKSMEWWVEQGDPQYWHCESTGEGKNVTLLYKPPSVNVPEWLLYWAQNCLEKNELQQDFTLNEALSAAKELDTNDVFKGNGNEDEYERIQIAGAVAGVAYVLAKFAKEETWDDITAMWVTNTLRRAAAFTDNANKSLIIGPFLSKHPLILAVHGNAALIMRGHNLGNTQRELFNLVLNSFDAVAETISMYTDNFAHQSPQLHWELFVLLVNRCMFTEHTTPNYDSTDKNGDKQKYHSLLISNAEKALATGIASPLPQIPLPWVKKSDRQPETTDYSGYERNSVQFLTDLAMITVLQANIPSLISDNSQRQQILRLLEQMVSVTFQQLLTPFEGVLQENFEKPQLEWFEWLRSYFLWLGKFAQYLSAKEIEKVILRPIFTADKKNALLAMEYFSSGYAKNHILPPADPSNDTLALWDKMADWVIENSEDNDLKYVDRESSHCVLTLLFYFQDNFEEPPTCLAESGWKHLPRFEKIFERVVEKFGNNKAFYFKFMCFMQEGGLDFIPGPGIKWLHKIAMDKRHDRQFWSANGDVTVSVLNLIFEKKGKELTDEHRKILTSIIDLLVENGVPGAGILQQDQHRKA